MHRHRSERHPSAPCVRVNETGLALEILEDLKDRRRLRRNRPAETLIHAELLRHEQQPVIKALTVRIMSDAMAAEEETISRLAVRERHIQPRPGHQAETDAALLRAAMLPLALRVAQEANAAKIKLADKHVRRHGYAKPEPDSVTVVGSNYDTVTPPEPPVALRAPPVAPDALGYLQRLQERRRRS